MFITLIWFHERGFDEHYAKNVFLVPVRLGGTGSSAKEGHVEGLGTNGKWGGICDHGFDINDV